MLKNGIELYDDVAVSPISANPISANQHIFPNYVYFFGVCRYDSSMLWSPPAGSGVRRRLSETLFSESVSSPSIASSDVEGEEKPLRYPPII